MLKTINDSESEQLVIGTLLSESVETAYWLSMLNADCFLDGRLATLYLAMKDILERGDVVNMLSVDEQMRLHYPNVMVSPADLAVLMELDRPDNMRQAVTVLHLFRGRRQLLRLADYLETRAMDVASSPVEETILKAYAMLDGIELSPMGHGKSLETVAPALQKRMDDNLRPETRHTGPLTGMEEIDQKAGLPESGLMILGGYTSHGKSAFANHMALINAQRGMNVAIFSKEMTNLETLSRMVASGTQGTSASWIMHRALNTEEYRQAVESLNRLRTECGDKVFFDDSRSLQLTDVTASIRRLHKERKIKMAFVDYLQLLSHDAMRNRNSTQEQLVAYYSRVLKNLGDQLGVLIVALSQLNRSSQHLRPSLAVIRDSGQIAECSDYVLFVWNPGVNHMPYDGEYAQCPTKATVLLIVGKNRQGATMELLTGWKAQTTSYYNLTTDQIECLKAGRPLPSSPAEWQGGQGANPSSQMLWQGGQGADPSSPALWQGGQGANPSSPMLWQGGQGANPRGRAAFPDPQLTIQLDQPSLYGNQ